MCRALHCVVVSEAVITKACKIKLNLKLDATREKWENVFGWTDLLKFLPVVSYQLFSVFTLLLLCFVQMCGKILHLCFDNNVFETFWRLKPLEIKLNWQKTTVNHSPPPGFIFIKSWNQVINNTFPFLLQVCVWFAPWRRLTDTSRKWLDLLRLWKQLCDVFCVSGGSSESNSDDVTWDFESLH